MPVTDASRELYSPPIIKYDLISKSYVLAAYFGFVMPLTSKEMKFPMAVGKPEVMVKIRTAELYVQVRELPFDTPKPEFAVHPVTEKLA